MSAYATLFEFASQGDGDALLKALPDEPPPSHLRNKDGATLILHCCYRGLFTVAGALAARSGQISLHEAAALGDLDRAAKMVEHCPELLHTLSTDGWTPLHLAALFGRDQLAHLLIDHGAPVDVFSRAFERNLPLHAACASPKGSGDLVRRLASLTSDLQARQSNGQTALMLAAATGKPDAVEALLEHGADPTLKSLLGRTASQLAAERGYSELAARLAPAEPSP